MLGGFGAGLMLAGTRAEAFTQVDCTTHPHMGGCTELMRHKTLLADLDREFIRRGVPEAERKALEAQAICPFCGQLLIG